MTKKRKTNGKNTGKAISRKASAMASGRKTAGRKALAAMASTPSFSHLSQSAWVARKVSHVVKRKGHAEPFEQEKAYASIYFACRSTHMGEQESEMISKVVCQRLKQWILTRRQVDSKEIFHFIGSELSKINPEVAFMYNTHRDIS